jgi:hypothetical protein
MGKCGVGPVIPHVENSLFRNKTTKAFNLEVGIWV